MFITNKEVDLGKSFEKLKQSLKDVYAIASSGKEGCHSRALGQLESAVKIHLIKCTDLDMKQIQDYMEMPDNPDTDADDLKHANI